MAPFVLRSTPGRVEVYNILHYRGARPGFIEPDNIDVVGTNQIDFFPDFIDGKIMGNRNAMERDEFDGVDLFEVEGET